MKTCAVLLPVLAMLASVSASEAGTSYYEPAQFFRTQILPILQRRCYECHSHEHEVEGELALDSKLGWETGGENGPAVKPGDLKNSPLIQAIRHLDSDSAMPPKKKLPPIEIALLETWVLLGAPDPRTASPVSKP
jgi:Planctomycete cytochrome C